MVFISPKANVLQTIFNNKDKIVTELGLKGKLELPQIVVGTQVQLINHYNNMVKKNISEEVLSTLDNPIRPVFLVKADNYPMKYMYMPFNTITNLISTCNFNEEIEAFYSLSMRRLYGHVLKFMEISSMYNNDAYTTETVYDSLLREHIEYMENVKASSSPLDFHGYLVQLYNSKFEKTAADLANLDTNKLIGAIENVLFRVLLDDNQECQTLNSDDTTLYSFMNGSIT